MEPSTHAPPERTRLVKTRVELNIIDELEANSK
jgi:hypothetical protein